MKSVAALFALLSLLSIGTAMPACADTFDNWLAEISRRSLASSGDTSERPRIMSEPRVHRRRVAMATRFDDEDFDYRPRRAEERKAQRHSRTRSASGGEQDVRIRRSAEPRTPRWTRKSLAQGGSTGSGQSGVASYYWQPQRVASGGWFNPNALTAAHRSLPFGTRVRVTHAGNGRSVDVLINDRGPFIAGRIIDLSRAAAKMLGMTSQGIAKVKVKVLGR
jgi:rare lipoprotein A